MPAVDPKLPDDFVLPETVSVQPALGGRRHSARRHGKTYRLAERASQRCGLKVETCLDLLTSGWTLVETTNQPARWYDPSYRLTRRP